MRDFLAMSLAELAATFAQGDLTWKEEVTTLARIHHLALEEDPEWTQMHTADFLGIDAPSVSMTLRVARDLNHSKVQNAPNLLAAYSICQRLDSKAQQQAMAEIASVNVWERAGYHAPKVRPEVEDTVLQENFLAWAPNYRGEKFNFIHCDFPSIPIVHDGKWADLFECLTLHLDNLLAPAGHVIFWLHPAGYEINRVCELLCEAAPSLHFDPVPLVWLKSDLAGTSPDPALWPRRVYETALLATRQDRPLVRTLANAYASPSATRLHPEAKPEPMLKHFFKMIVRSGTRMLDPACGAGTSLLAAEALGADYVLGLEVDPNYCGLARDALRKARTLRSLPFAD